MTREFFASASPEFAAFAILVWALTGAVMLGGLAILWFQLVPFARQWWAEAFGPEPVAPTSTVVSFALRRPRAFTEPAAKGWDHDRPKLQAIVGGRAR